MGGGCHFSGMVGPSITSLDCLGESLPRVPSLTERELQRRVSEEVTAWGWPLAYQWLQNTPWFGGTSGHPGWLGGASGTTNDRRGGRDLPLYWSEVDLRGFRVLARFLADTNPYAIGFLGRLVDYHVRKGYGWQACKRGAAKSPYPTVGAPTDPLVAKGQRVLDGWRDAQLWPLQSREAFRRWRRDGEVFGRLFGQGRDKHAQFRFVEPEQVGDPHGATDGPFSFGIETDPDDVRTVRAFFVRDMDGDGTRGEWIESDRIVHARANVDSTVKRGLPDFFPVHEQLDATRRLMRNMVETAVDQAAIAWMEKFPTATPEQVRTLIPQQVTTPGQSVATGGGANPYPWPWMGSGAWSAGNKYNPGTVYRTEGNRQFEPGPTSAGVPNYIEIVQATLRGCGARWGMPEYFSGDASNNNFASSLVSGSPFSVAVEGCQLEWGAVFERPVALKVLECARDAGMLTWDEWRQLDVEVTEPAVISPQPDKDTQTFAVWDQNKWACKDTIRLKLGLDPQHEAVGLKKDAQSEQQQNPQNPLETVGSGDDFAQLGENPGGGDDLPSMFGESAVWVSEAALELVAEDKRVGLVKKVIVNKLGKNQTVYVRPDKDKPKGKPVAAPEVGPSPAHSTDPDANRPSRPENRHEGAKPKVLEWRDPPPPQGKKGGGKAVRPKGSQSQTKLGDTAEAKTAELGFRNILPAGRRMNKSVAEEGSSIDVEYDHSGRAYECKMCKTTATEYRAKPKPDEIEGKKRFAEMHGLQPYTLIAVMDQDSGEIHYYASKEPGITTKKLSPEHFDYVGTVSL